MGITQRIKRTLIWWALDFAQWLSWSDFADIMGDYGFGVCDSCDDRRSDEPSWYR